MTQVTFPPAARIKLHLQTDPLGDAFFQGSLADPNHLYSTHGVTNKICNTFGGMTINFKASEVKNIVLSSIQSTKLPMPNDEGGEFLLKRDVDRITHSLARLVDAEADMRS